MPPPTLTANARLDRIARAVRAYAPRTAERDPPFFEAAVSLTLRARGADAIDVLFIERATRDGDPWSGQIAFPGGRRDDADANLQETVLRETLEETGVDLRASGEIIGALDELRPRTPVLPPVIVRPFIALLSADVAVRESDELAGHFWAPLDVILAPETARDADVLVRGASRRVPALLYEGRTIWGMTERILQQFATVVGEPRAAGREP